MATNVERVTALLTALYDDNPRANKVKKLVDSVIDQLDQNQIEAAFQGATAATLTDEQKAFFVIESFKGSARNRVVNAVQRRNQQTMIEAREAARQAAADAAAGF